MAQRPAKTYVADLVQMLSAYAKQPTNRFFRLLRMVVPLLYHTP